MTQEILIAQETNESTLAERVRQMLYEWFVRYNPLYFFSALCVLSGMFLVSLSLQTLDWTPGQLRLTGIMHLYELLVLAGAAILFRKAGQDRPAVILGLIAMVLLFDGTFRTEVATTLEQHGRAAAIIWGVFALCKLFGLVWIFQLKLSATAFVVPVLSLLGIAGFPQLMQTYGQHRATIHLLATWYGLGLITLTYWQRPLVQCRLVLDEWGQTVLQRAATTAFRIWLVWYVVHLIVWGNLFSIELTFPYLLSLLLLVPLLARSEYWIWAGSCGTLVLTAYQDPALLSLAASVIAAVFVGRAWQMPCKRLYVGAVITGHLAVWTIGWQNWPLPELNLWLILATGAILVGMAWQFHIHSALLPLCAGLYPMLQFMRAFSLLEWGMVLLGGGFVALLAGIGFNLGLRRISRSRPDTPHLTSAPVLVENESI